MATDPQRLRRSRRPGLLGVRRASPLSSDLVTRADLATAFGNRFGHKIFLEPLCFPIDSSVSSLLLPMLPKNPQKVSRIGKTYAISLHRRSRARGVLGQFFLATAGIW